VAPAVMTEVVRVAQAVKDTPARSMLELAAKLLGTEAGVFRAGTSGTAAEPAAGAGEGAETAGGCCGGGPGDVEVPLVGVAATGETSSGCCG